MNGFYGSDAAGTIATWVAAGSTLLVWSRVAGWRLPFRLAQHLLAGLATGYLVVLAVRDVLAPQLVEPLLTNPGSEPLLWVALLLVVALAAGRWLPLGIAVVPIAVLVAGTAAFALGGAVVGTVLPQVGAAMLPPGGGVGGLLNAAISLAITALVLLAFLHGRRRSRMGALAAGTGRWLLLGGVGGWLGFLLVSRLALLVDRLGFLLGDWLGLLR